MEFAETRVYNFEKALYGMRHPLESYHKSDSYYESLKDYISHEKDDPIRRYIIGKNDMTLAQKLIKSGTEHRKFMRQIFVSVDITAPIYWWKEFDTYKIGTVDNSTSTMHKLSTTEITLDCFEIDDYSPDIKYMGLQDNGRYFNVNINSIIGLLENLRLNYIKTKDKKYWKELIRWLPESWLQTRTVTMNYENLRSIYFQRKNHKLNEWSGEDDNTKGNFIRWIKSLPYAKELIMYGEE